MPLVTDIVRQKKNKNYHSIFINNQYIFSLSSSDLDFLGIKINDNIPEDKLNDYIKIFSLQKAKDYAYRILSRKSYSEKAMMEKLIIRFPEKIAHEVIKGLKESGYINDEKFIKEYAVNKVQLSPMGPFKLKQELYNKKFEQKLIEKTVNEVYGEYDQYELALQLFEKRFKDIKKCNDRKVLNKIKTLLLSHGFDMNITGRIIESLHGEAG